MAVSSKARKETLRVRVDGRHDPRDDWTGTVERVNVKLLRLLLEADYLSRIDPAWVVGNRRAINVDGDRAPRWWPEHLQPKRWLSCRTYRGC